MDFIVPPYVMEVFIRTSLIFIFTTVLMRTRGKKQLGQITIFDILIIIALGSAVGDVMIYTEEQVPFMRSVVAVSTVFVLVTVIEKLLMELPVKVRNMIHGEPVILVKDGKLVKKSLNESNITKEELRSMLREKNVDYFSQAKKVILEPTGKLSITRKKKKNR